VSEYLLKLRMLSGQHVYILYKSNFIFIVKKIGSSGRGEYLLQINIVLFVCFFKIIFKKGIYLCYLSCVYTNHSFLKGVLFWKVNMTKKKSSNIFI